MLNTSLILFGKTFSKTLKTLNLGNGSTWPGHIALKANKHFIADITSKNPHLKIIIVGGTNGKTTTATLIRTILEKNGKRVFQNTSGANLLNGLASSLLLHSDVSSRLNYDYALFEVDENALPLVLKEVIPDYLVLLNLFRDQLDRYGEVRTIVEKWKKALEQLDNKTSLILNADDPQIAYLGHEVENTTYFGLNDLSVSQTSQDANVDSNYCPKCGEKLTYKKIYFSHLGDWSCSKCKLKRPHISLSTVPVYPLTGTYNRYNTLAAVLITKQIGIEQKNIEDSLDNFTPAFGRQETIDVGDKHIQIFLSKNPTSFNESLKTIAMKSSSTLLIVLNDRIPDGRDVSWIWDTDLEQYLDKFQTVIVSGDRCYDMALRIKYAQEFSIFNSQFSINEKLNEAIEVGLESIKEGETLYILPTYSAMLEVRKIVTGKKIL